eukprot:8336438-Lingulodinium_polyedra.AAC.1
MLTLLASRTSSCPWPGAGHAGICAGHYVFDGGLQPFLTKRMRGWHLVRAVDRAPAARGRGADPKLLALKEWVVATQCTAHGCHNGFKWGVED